MLQDITIFLLHRQNTPIQTWTLVEEREIKQKINAMDLSILNIVLFKILPSTTFFLRQNPQKVISNTKSASEIFTERQAQK